jgi:hypothetical protein
LAGFYFCFFFYFSSELESLSESEDEDYLAFVFASFASFISDFAFSANFFTGLAELSLESESELSFFFYFEDFVGFESLSESEVSESGIFIFLISPYLNLSIALLSFSLSSDESGEFGNS